MPGTPESTDSSTLLSLPPGTGHAVIEAKTMAGTWASLPNLADPSVLCATSTRGSTLEMKVNCDGVLITGSAASAIFAASAASSPKHRLRPEDLCVTTLCAAPHSDAGTFQRAAAAATSRSRALA